VRREGGTRRDTGPSGYHRTLGHPAWLSAWHYPLGTPPKWGAPPLPSHHATSHLGWGFLPGDPPSLTQAHERSAGGELGPVPCPQTCEAFAFPVSHHDGLDPPLGIFPSPGWQIFPWSLPQRPRSRQLPGRAGGIRAAALGDASTLPACADLFSLPEAGLFPTSARKVPPSPPPAPSKTSLLQGARPVPFSKRLS